MTNERPLRPERPNVDDAYRTEQATPEVAPSGDPLEPESAAPGSDSRPWLIVGLVLLGVFVILLVYAVVLPAFA